MTALPVPFTMAVFSTLSAERLPPFSLRVTSRLPTEFLTITSPWASATPSLPLMFSTSTTPVLEPISMLPSSIVLVTLFALPMVALPLPFTTESPMTFSALRLPSARFTSTEPAECTTFMSPCASEAVSLPLMVSTLTTSVFESIVKSPSSSVVVTRFA